MSERKQNRRGFLKASSTALTTAVAAPYWFTASHAAADETQAKNDRPHVGCIGIGGMGSGDSRSAKRFGEIVAVCDVDRNHRERAKNDGHIGGGKADAYEDYRKLLDRDDIDLVTIGTPDHWHSKIAIEAMQSGKDVWCQKPLTLTIEEGKQICKVAKETKRVFQVGAQQRSEMGLLFLRAIAVIRDGRIGKVQRVQCAIGGAPSGGPFKKEAAPTHLNWDMWLGQAPSVPYIKERSHGNFRWWYEYSGGKMTDWGAHHVDIAHWGMDKENTGPISIESVSATHPVPFENGYPTIDDRFNTATAFSVLCKFADGVELVIRHDTDNGVLFEGDKGRIFVNRGRLTGEAIDELKENPLPEDALVKAYKGKQPGDHMRNFFECVKDRSLPISDVFSHHRALTTCHLANIANRLGRKLNWDPEAEQMVGDDEANAWQSREQRKGYEIVV